MDTLGLYLDQGLLDFVVSLFGLVPAGILLALCVWLVSYLVYACMRWLRGRF